MSNRGAYLGEVDGDGIIWMAMAGGSPATNKALLGFIGIAASGDPEDSIKLCAKSTVATDIIGNYAKIVPIDADGFLLFFSDTSSDFKCKQINLA